MTTTILRQPDATVASLAETLAVLRAHEAEIRKLGATALFLYGSAARDELGPDSDVDVFVDFERDGTFTFVELIRLEMLLKTLLRRDVDLTTRDGLHPRLRSGIVQSCTRAF